MDKFQIIIAISITSLFLTIPLTTSSANTDKFEWDYVTYSSSTDNFGTPDLILEIGNPAHENFLTNDDNSGTLLRGWTENVYKTLVTEPYTATREVIDHYRIEPIYEVGGDVTPYSTVNFRNLTSYQCRDLEDRKDTGFWRDLFWGSRWPNEEVEPNSFQNTDDFTISYRDYGWQAFQGFALWNRHLVHPNYTESYSIWVPHVFHFLHQKGSKEIPIYITEEYTAYHNTVYEIKDYRTENWPSISIPITVRCENGYESNVEIDFKTNDNLIQGDLENKFITISSEELTYLNLQVNLQVSPDLWEGSGSVKVMVTDGYEIETENLEIGFVTESKPDVENIIVKEWDSEIKPDEEGDGSTTNKHLLGVGGDVRDSETLNGIDEPLMTVDGCQFSGESFENAGVAGLRVSRADGSYIYASERWPGQSHTFSVTADHSDYYSSSTKEATDDSNSDITATKNFELEYRY